MKKRIIVAGAGHGGIATGMMLAKEGFDVASDSKNFIILNTTLTDELVNEGIARELVSKIQNIRKSSGFEITDKINITLSKNAQIDDAINEATLEMRTDKEDYK
mgnify:CR=1 FL=1